MLVFTSLLYILHSTTLCPGLNTSASSSYASGSLMMHAQLVIPKNMVQELEPTQKVKLLPNLLPPTTT